MQKLAKKESADARKLVLGFDAGCSTCTEIAQRIEEKIGSEIEILSLSDPHMEHWRKQALGEKAPWAPTLVEVKNGEIKAWTGLQLGVRLSHALGPIATWRVMQALGEASANEELETSSASRTIAGFTRGQFLKGVSGAVVAVSAISGVGSLASSAHATENKTMQLSKTSNFTGKRKIRIIRKVARYRDVRNVVPQHLHNIAQRNGSDAKAGIHTLNNGNKMLVVAAELPKNYVVVYYETRHKRTKGQKSKVVESEANLFRIDVDKKEAILVQSSANGAPDHPLYVSPDDTLSGQQIPRSQVFRRRCCAGCRGNKPASERRYRSFRCRRYSLSYIAGTCGLCVPQCFTVAGCFLCALYSCGLGSIALCCRRYRRICKLCGPRYASC